MPRRTPFAGHPCADARPDLVTAAHELIEASLAGSTKRTYGSAVRSYLEFAAEARIEHPIPAGEHDLVLWVAWLSKKPKPTQHRTVKVYLSALATYHQTWGVERLLEGKPMLMRVIMGLKKLQGDSTRRTRLPITTSLLSELSVLLDRTVPEHRMLWSAMTTATYGLFRLGELTVTRDNRDVDNRALKLGQLQLYSPAGTVIQLPSLRADSLLGYYSITLHASKTDPWRSGITVTISGSAAVSAMQQQLLCHPSLHRSSSPLFAWPSGRALHRQSLVNAVQQLITLTGRNASSYTGHSFRRGGAQSLRNAGVPDGTIQIMGRWKSDCFNRYIDIDTAAVISAGRAM